MAATSVGSKNSFLERLPTRAGYADEGFDQYPKLARSTLRLLLLTLFYLVFLVIGASIFSAIESPGEVEMIKDVAETKRNFVEDHECISGDEFDELLTALLKAHDRGVSAVRNASSHIRNWSFGQSFFFSGTIITTIGYGHVAPLSEGGKLFCVIYGLLGIPLTLILLSAYVERLHRPTTSFLKLVHEKFSHLYQPFHIRMIHLAAIGAVIFLIFFIAPAMVFQRLEPNWTFLDGLYYCFISLTTIGLGDYVPGDSPDQEYRTLYKILVTAYLIVGLTFMMLLLSLFSEIPQLNFGLWFLIKSEEAGAALPFASYAASSHSSQHPATADGASSRGPGLGRARSDTVDAAASAELGSSKGSSSYPAAASASASLTSSGAATLLQQKRGTAEEPTASTALLSGSSLSSSGTAAVEKSKLKGSPAGGAHGGGAGSGFNYYQAQDNGQQPSSKRSGDVNNGPSTGRSSLITSNASSSGQANKRTPSSAKASLGRTTSSAGAAGYSSTPPAAASSSSSVPAAVRQQQQQQYPPTNPFGAAASSATTGNTNSPFQAGSSNTNSAAGYAGGGPGSPFVGGAPNAPTTSFVAMTSFGPSGQITQKVKVKSRPLDSPSPDDPDQMLDLK